MATSLLEEQKKFWKDVTGAIIYIHAHLISKVLKAVTEKEMEMRKLKTNMNKKCSQKGEKVEYKRIMINQM